MYKFKSAKEVLSINNITVNLKQMSGDIISITYDTNKETIEEVINRDIMEEEYRGYIFFLIRENEYFNSEDSELNDGDILDIFITPKSFEVSIIFLEESLRYNTPMDVSAWFRGEFYNKYIITIKEKVDDLGEYKRNVIPSCHKYEYIFYFRNDKYIPSSSVIVINEGKYDDEDHIMIIEENPVFSNIKDMIGFLLRDLYEINICNDIKDMGIFETFV